MRSPSQTTQSSATKVPEVNSYAWHAHGYLDVLHGLGSAEEGLSSAEANERLLQYGANEFSVPEVDSFLKKIGKQLLSPLSIVLLAAFFVTFFLEEYLDAGVIAIALLVAVFLTLWQEGKASRAFSVLSNAQVAKATIYRDGQRHEMDARTLVPGDIVELQAGMQVPADIRIMHAKHFSTNEASLTGEWMAVEKDASVISVGTPLSERSNMAFKGTSVQNGFAVGVVVATGDKTEVGTIANDLHLVKTEETPLQAETKALSYILLYVISGLILLVAVVGVLLGQSTHDMALLSIAMAVAAIPEGLPAAVTIVLAVGMESLLKRGGLVRSLLAAETLGSTSYILTDKTGTLTEARMSVTGVIFGAEENFEPESWKSSELISDIIATAYCATDTYIEEVATKKVLRGEPTERAVSKTALSIKEASMYLDSRIDYLPFNSDQQYAAGLSETGLGKRLCLSGAPEKILAKASFIKQGEQVVELTPELREQMKTSIAAHTRAGKRLIGVAYRYSNISSIPTEKEEALKGSIFAGVLVLSDPVRPGIKEAIKKIKEAGAKIILVTGDNPETALSIAKAVGIAGVHESALTGTEMNELTDEELLGVLTHVHVFARMLPRQKMRLTSVLQKSGEIVAMTGDGVNDAPALQKANIGIALGSGTQVAKEASDLILTHDSFATMYSAIEEGRRVGSNIRKIVGYLLATSFSEIVLIGAAVFSGAAAPLLPAQILWANIIEEGLMSVAFAFEKGEKGAMKRRPRDIHEEGILSRYMIAFLAMSVTVLSILSVSLYFFLRSRGLSLPELQSAMFLSIAMDSLFIAFAFRSLSVPVWRTPIWSNRFFLGSFLVSLILLFGALSIPFMREVLSYVPLPGSIVALVVAVSFAGLLVIELAKWVFFERRD